MKPHYHRTAAEVGFKPIPRDLLPTMLNKPIHLSWARNGARWLLRVIDGDTITLETERTKRTRIDRAEHACYVRRFEPQDE